MVLEDKDIIQVDATVSTGVLIFLTLTNNTGITKGHPVQFFGDLVVIFPFSISAILIVFENRHVRLA